MKHHLLQTFICFSLLFLLSCRGEEPKRIPTTMPDVTGQISEVSLSTDDQARAVISVRSVEGIEAQYNSATITINDKTLIESAGGKELKLEHLQKGQEIQVWFDGDVLESMPVQGYAKAIRIK